MEIMKYIQYLLLTACIVQNSTLGPETPTTVNNHPITEQKGPDVPEPITGTQEPPSQVHGPREKQKAPQPVRFALQPACNKKKCNDRHKQGNHQHGSAGPDCNAASSPENLDFQCPPCATGPMKSPKCHDGHAHPDHEHHNDSPAASSPKDESANPDLKCTPCATEYMPEDHHHTQPESPNVTKHHTHRRTRSTPEPTPEAPANESGNPQPMPLNPNETDKA